MTDPQHRPERRFWRWWARHWQLGPVAAGIALLLLCIVSLWLFLALASCGRAPAAAAPTPPPAAAVPTPPQPADAPPTAAPLADRVAYWERRAIVLEGAANAARTEVRALRQEAALAPLRALTAWAAWIGGAVALLAVVAGVLLKVGVGLPVGGRLIAGCGIAGLALAAAAVGLGQALPWIGPVGLGLLALLVVGGLAWAAWTWHRGGRVAAAEWVRYAEQLPTTLRRQLDEESLEAQGRLRSAVDALLGRKES